MRDDNEYYEEYKTIYGEKKKRRLRGIKRLKARFKSGLKQKTKRVPRIKFGKGKRFTVRIKPGRIAY